jgi:hypothetical protein
MNEIGRKVAFQAVETMKRAWVFDWVCALIVELQLQAQAVSGLEIVLFREVFKAA